MSSPYWETWYFQWYFWLRALISDGTVAAAGVSKAFDNGDVGRAVQVDGESGFFADGSQDGPTTDAEVQALGPQTPQTGHGWG